MFARILLVGLTILIQDASAQTIVDGSDNAAPRETIAAAIAAVAARQIYPSSTQFRSLSQRHNNEIKVDFICGEFNGKTVLGGYFGFRAFAYNIRNGTTVIAGGYARDHPSYSVEKFLFKLIGCSADH